mmetsp:Transcript_39168/g.90443  ORF Transcript_39168/g.90443 Transcript_39168/m.90443 type:complete len:84 (-) Transcript_39168:149-400(-)
MVYLEIADVQYEPCLADRGALEPCYGDPTLSGYQDGGDVLDSLGNIFGAFSSTNRLLEDVLVPLGLAVALPLGCHLLLHGCPS